MQLHKTDHRMSAFVTLDAARAAAYNLYFLHHRINEGLQPFIITEYLFYSTRESNFEVDVTAVSDKKICSRVWHVRQSGAGNFKSVGPEPDRENLKKLLTSNTERIAKGEKVTERFRRLTQSMSF